MENSNETFHYTYNGAQRSEVERIRSKYMPKEPDKLEQLRALDRSAYSAAQAVAIILGVVGSLIMGTGMSLCMTEFGAFLGLWAMPVGIGVGLAGMVLVILAYPVYSAVLKLRRRQLAPRILQLTDELMQQ